jgi:hypothetical protein
MFKLIAENNLPETKFFRGRPTSKLRTLPEFVKAIQAVQKNLIPQGQALEITLTQESIDQFGNSKNLETRFMQLLMHELKKGRHAFQVRKRTIEKGERPHLYLVHKIESQKVEDFEQSLQTIPEKTKKRSAAA